MSALVAKARTSEAVDMACAIEDEIRNILPEARIACVWTLILPAQRSAYERLIYDFYG